MGIKKIILLLVVLSVIVSGCLNSGEDQDQEDNDSGDYGSSGGSSGGTQRYEEMQTQEETITPEEAVTSDQIETPVETETFGETGTPEETETAEEMLTPEGAGGIEEEQTENIAEEGEEIGIEQSAEGEPRTYLVRLREYVIIPSELEINTGDLVVWRNFEDTLFTLTSEEGLFEDQRLGYGNTFNYTFNETGNFSFSVSGYPNMRMTITVK